MLTPAATAHLMLTQALADAEVDVAGLRGDELADAYIWLRDRGAAVLRSALRPHELLDGVVFLLQARATPAANGQTPELAWQQRAAIEIMGVEITGDAAAIDERVGTYLAVDPDGVLQALAVVVAHLYRLHDGDGAPAMLRAMAPDPERATGD